ncbi:DNA-3-methyladenine glycosylase [Demequina sp. SO4-13]|uniref:DNA-3-methyladenine glycosylase n=1 Tax=Demequina sp. SO4-13 TaxID=3401027 RepID=UPI003AF75E8C
MQRSDLARPAHEVAPALLGARLTHDTADGAVTIEITEVEAYSGAIDPASHSHRGPTERNRVMFGEAGHLYVYLSYGMHWCANIVTGTAGEGSGVLLRAGAVVAGTALARERRGLKVTDRNLARGPACLAQALGIDISLSAADVLGGSPLRLEPGRAVEAGGVARGPRVGVRLAPDLPWRFWIAGDPTVSAYKRNPRAVPRPTGS